MTSFTGQRAALKQAWFDATYSRMNEGRERPITAARLRTFINGLFRQIPKNINESNFFDDGPSEIIEDILFQENQSGIGIVGEMITALERSYTKEFDLPSPS